MVYTVPFLSFLTNIRTEESFFCVINLISKNTISYYNIGKIESMEEYDSFMQMAQKWWDSCPIIPISVYYHYELKKYEYIKEIINNNEYRILKGFSGVSLNNLTDKRIKRHIINVDKKVISIENK